MIPMETMETTETMMLTTETMMLTTVTTVTTRGVKLLSRKRFGDFVTHKQNLLGGLSFNYGYWLDNWLFAYSSMTKKDAAP